MRTMLRAVFVTVCLVFLLVGAAQAQIPSLDKNEGDFRFIIAPYIWLTSLNGTLGAKGYETKVHASFSDLSKYLNMGAMAHVEMIYQNRIGLLSDFNYTLLGEQLSRKRISLDASTTLILTDIVGFYRFGNIPLTQGGGTYLNLDLLGGARIWSMGMGLKLDWLRGGRDMYAVHTWADPIVGIRTEFHIGDAWAISLRGGMGGFSVSSYTTWDGTGTVSYTFCKYATLALGYRIVGANYETGSGSDSFKFDASLSGPIIGVAFAF